MAERFGKGPWELEELDGDTLQYWFDVISLEGGMGREMLAKAYQKAAETEPDKPVTSRASTPRKPPPAPSQRRTAARPVPPRR